MDRDRLVAAALAFVREATGAERCSLVRRSPGGGSDLWTLEDGAPGRRRLPIVPTQLLEHFTAHPAAERRGDLGSSESESDRHLAAKGYAEVVRAPLRDPAGGAPGALLAAGARRRPAPLRARAGPPSATLTAAGGPPAATERDRGVLEGVAAALAALLAPAV